jgi:hypothetical protein
MNKYISGKTRDILLIYPHQTFFLFPKLKSMLKGRRFKDTEDSKRSVTKELFALHANQFRKRFQQFYDHAQKCVASQGELF